MPSKPSPCRYVRTGPDDPVTWFDVLTILDTHGLRLSPRGKGQRSPEAKFIRREWKAWVKRQGIRPDLNYTMPLRALTEHITREHPELIMSERGCSWAVVVDALNDPHSGLELVRRRYATKAA